MKVTILYAIYGLLLHITGFTAMKRMAVSNVLIVGMHGLGVEIGRVVFDSNAPTKTDGFCS